MTCSNKKKNLKSCNCDYNPCPRKGQCCECVSYHRENGQLPACLREDGGDVFGSNSR